LQLSSAERKQLGELQAAVPRAKEELTSAKAAASQAKARRQAADSLLNANLLK